MTEHPCRIAVLGARLARWQGKTELHAFEPADGARMTAFLAGVAAVVFALGAHSLRAITVFLDATAG